MRTIYALALVVCGLMPAISASAQQKLTNEDVEAHEVKPIPIVKSRETTTHPPIGSPPPPRNSYRSSQYRDYSTQYDPESAEAPQPSESTVAADPEDAQRRLERLLRNITRSKKGFDPYRYSRTKSFRGGVSIQVPSLPKGTYCLVFCTDSRTAYRLGGVSAQARIYRSGRGNMDVQPISVQLSGDIYNFYMSRSGEVGINFDLPKEVHDVEGYVAYTIVPLDDGHRLEMRN